MHVRLQGLLRGPFLLAMSRKIFKISKPACLSATVTDPVDRELVERFKSLSRASEVSVQRLLLVDVSAVLETEKG